MPAVYEARCFKKLDLLKGNYSAKDCPISSTILFELPRSIPSPRQQFVRSSETHPQSTILPAAFKHYHCAIAGMDSLSAVALSTSLAEDGSCDVDSGNEAWKDGGKLSLSTWLKDMTGHFTGFTADYLLDTSIPWCKKPYTHIFVEVGNTATNKRKWTGKDEKKRREAIILEISRRALKESTVAPIQPLVRFVNDEIYVTVSDAAFLESLWRSPLVYQGKELKIAYRGLPWSNITVWKLASGEPMTMQELEHACRAFKNGRKDLIQIFAGFYEVRGMQTGPIYNGEVLVFWSNFFQRKNPKFNGETLQVVYYGEDSDVETDGE
ncbi:uncharacterized protein MEPE_04125 [Melanopsichium pennsylvanicum]|uniref:Uncharacterized protein n=1 Tax=Melanopsichium pennsylvanicum TaxID=63383 RepID=A0AAJ4XP84_9BASI|nr:uncharacterized protein MEPE_04125 [Melanopsichium pennsylvanicum]